MSRLTVEMIPDLEQGSFTARVPDIPAYGEGDSEGPRSRTCEKLSGPPLKPLALTTPLRA